MLFERKVPYHDNNAVNLYGSLIEKYTGLLNQENTDRTCSPRSEMQQRQLNAICKDPEFIFEVIFILLFSSALVEKDYAFITRLYKILNLYDNKRLLKTKKENILNGSLFLLGKEYSISAADLIYECVIFCAAEECSKNRKNVQLWDTIAEYIFGIYDKYANTNIVKSGYWASFLPVYCTEIPPEFTDYNVRELVEVYNNGERLFNNDRLTQFETIVNDYYDIQSPMNRRRYDKLLNTVSKEICIYANCKSFSEFVTRVHNSLGFYFNTNWESQVRKLTTISSIVKTVMDSRQLSIGILCADAPAINEDYVRKHLIRAIQSELIERGFFDDCYDISKVEITNYEAILYNMVFSIYVDAICCSMNQVLDGYFHTFSFEKVDNAATIQEMTRQINTLSNQKMKAEGQLLRLQRKYDYVEKLLKAKTKEEGRIIDEHIQGLEKRNEELTADNAKLQAQIKSLEEYLALQTKEEEPLNNEINTSLLYSNRYLFVGGRIETIAELKTIFTSSVFTSNETDSINAGNIDYIVMFPKYMSHALYYKCINIARDNGIKVIYVLDNNMDIILKKITEEIS